MKKQIKTKYYPWYITFTGNYSGSFQRDIILASRPIKALKIYLESLDLQLEDLMTQYKDTFKLIETDDYSLFSLGKNRRLKRCWEAKSKP